jgi:hypothetical protein
MLLFKIKKPEFIAKWMKGNGRGVNDLNIRNISPIKKLFV